MKMINSIFVTVLFAASIVAIPRLHIPAAGGRIVDGDNANIQDYPYQVSIEYNGKYICSGSIIHELHVLTAAHCTDLRLIKDFKVRTSTSEQKKGGLLIDVDNICQHSKYDPLTFEYDVSVLTLTHNITFGPNAKAILLANDTAAPIAEGTIANVTGWGSVWAIGPTSPQLQVTKVALVGQANCQNSYGACDPITDKMLCFNNTRTGNDVCRGDSGGPVVINDVQVGVVSWGGGCARPGKPGVYANVSPLKEKISKCVRYPHSIP